MRLSNLHSHRKIVPTILHDVLLRAEKQAAERKLVLFDLDSTLLDNRPRQARILREFGEHAGVPALRACTAEHFAGWSLKVPMMACGLSTEEAAALEPEARKYWRQHFFTSEYCKDDRPIHGAVDFVHRVLRSGAAVVYCTGRHEEMRQGTLDCFAREGFPLPASNQVYLIMKPVLELHDDDWKRLAREKVLALGQVVAAFDNEPTHINIYRDHFPDALCIHLATDDSARGVPVHPDIPSVLDFILP